MKFTLYKQTSPTFWYKLKTVDISSLEELKNIYEDYGNGDEPLKVYFDDPDPDGNYAILVE